MVIDLRNMEGTVALQIFCRFRDMQIEKGFIDQVFHNAWFSQLPVFLEATDLASLC